MGRSTAGMADMSENSSQTTDCAALVTLSQSSCLTAGNLAEQPRSGDSV